MKVERTGKENGLDFEVVATPMGHRCGYVRIPKGHALFGVDYCDAAPGMGETTVGGFFAVHGGLTFSGPRNEEGDWWLGFDCMHLGDVLDPEIADPEYLMRMRSYGFLSGGEVRTAEYVENECRSLAKQISERYPEKGATR